MNPPPVRSKPTASRPSIRRPSTRRKARRQPLSWKQRLVLAASAALLALLAWAALARQFAPTSNTALTRFDAIVVLGRPADSDGNPTPEQLARVTEAVHEYKRGAAPRLILTGGAAHNKFVEAQVMARSARAQGIPESAITLEPNATDTLQNACYSGRIMQAHDWRSAEIVTSAANAPRAALIFNALPLKWAIHAAPTLAPESSAYETLASTVELLKTARYLVWARWTEHCEP